MATYVLVYKGGGMPQTDEARAASLSSWLAWYTTLGQSVVDAGNLFGPSAAVGSDGAVIEGDPSGLSGYTILSADNLAAATELAKGCPILKDGGSIEVYETFAAM
jgi:hypothetical protein